METSKNANSILASAFLQNTIENNVIAVKAEDVVTGSGIDYSKHFFEAKVGSTYLIKFLPNPAGEPITHRAVYKKLPDPERKGKTFHYISSGNAKTCKVLQLFFDLNAKKKEGDAIASKKIEKYLAKTNQACAKIQILQSPVPEEIGMIRMFAFATFGPNATVANLIKKKIDPTKEQLAQDFEKEDIFDIFSSSVMSLVCEEAIYDGVKGRDFTKSDWAPKPKGAIAILENGETRMFKKEDFVGGKLSEEVTPWFNQFVENVCHEDYDVYKYFSFKEVDDKRNDKDTNDYLINLAKKVDEIVPIIENSSLDDIAKYGKADSTDGKEPKADAAKNVMADSIPDELKGSILSQVADVKTVVENPAEDAELKDILDEEN